MKIYNQDFAGIYYHFDRPYEAKQRDVLRCEVRAGLLHDICLVITEDELASKTGTESLCISCESFRRNCLHKISLRDDCSARIGLFEPPPLHISAQVQTTKTVVLSRLLDIDLQYTAKKIVCDNFDFNLDVVVVRQAKMSINTSSI